jgi:hypothetical protein
MNGTFEGDKNTSISVKGREWKRHSSCANIYVNLKQKNIIALFFPAVLFISGNLHAQISSLPAHIADSPVIQKAVTIPGLNPLGVSSHSGNSLPGNLFDPKLSLGSGINFRTNPLSNDLLNPNALRRGNILPREVLFDAQHFTLGASYNYGLNNMLKGGGWGSMNTRNPGLSLHAGFRF